MFRAYKRWRVKMKEKGNDTILTPEVWGEKTKEDVIAFFGLENEDVEWYQIIDLDDEQAD